MITSLSLWLRADGKFHNEFHEILARAKEGSGGRDTRGSGGAGGAGGRREGCRGTGLYPLAWRVSQLSSVARKIARCAT
jgi:hypothetical protein